MMMSEVENQQPRRGEILASDLANTANKTKTTKLNDTNYEIGNPNWGTARFNNRMVLELRVRDSGDNYFFDYHAIEKLVIGRRDPTNNKRPDVDLEPHDALNKGVSRTHALIVRREGALAVVDQEAPNGTFLNGQKLVPFQPRVLRDGDDIRLGHLVVRITFRRHQNTEESVANA